MADGDVAREAVEVLLAERVGYEADVGEIAEGASVADGDAGALLTAVLEGEESEVGDLRRFTVGRAGEVCADDAARVVRGVVFGVHVVGSRGHNTVPTP